MQDDVKLSKQISFVGADLTDAHLDGCNLEEADFTNATRMAVAIRGALPQLKARALENLAAFHREHPNAAGLGEDRQHACPELQFRTTQRDAMADR